MDLRGPFPTKRAARRSCSVMLYDIESWTLGLKGSWMEHRTDVELENCSGQLAVENLVQSEETLPPSKCQSAKPNNGNFENHAPHLCQRLPQNVAGQETTEWLLSQGLKNG